MKAILKLHYFVLFIALSFLFSCSEKSNVLPVADLNSDSITVERAKYLYDKQMSVSKIARKSKRKRKETPLWNTGRYKKMSNGKSALIVTVEEEKDALTLVYFGQDSLSSKTFEELYTTVTLAVYKDDDGVEHIERMFVKADLDYAKRKNYFYNDSDFSGIIWFEDLDDNLLRSFRYKNGQILSMELPKLISNENARVAEEITCTRITETVTTTTSYYSIACAGSGTAYDCGPPKFLYNTTGIATYILWEACVRSGYMGGGGGGPFDHIQDSGFQDWWIFKINPVESNWLLQNPGKAYQAYENFKRAEVSSMQRFGGAVTKDEDGTNQNAYKHAYAAALHTRSWGPNVALTIMNNHEYGDNYLNVAMDSHNNALGINTANHCECEGEALRSVIQSRIANGEGRRLVGSGFPHNTSLQPTNGKNIDED